VWDHPLLVSGDPLSRREAWLWLISEAAWKPIRVRRGSLLVNLNRGQVGHALRHIAKEWRWAEATSRRFLLLLKNDAMIDARSDAGITVITICNYDRYQIVGLPNDAASDAPNDALVTQEEREEVKKERADAVMRARAIELCEQVYDIFGFDREFIPPDWMGLTHYLDAGLRAGWNPDIVRLSARKIAAKKRGSPPRNFRYLGPVIVEEHERAAAPVPAARSEQTTLIMPINGGAREAVERDNRQPWQVRKDDRFAALTEFGAGLDAAERASGGGG
jgi:hypothetical protein